MIEQTKNTDANNTQITGLPRLLTYQDAADILAVKPQTLRQWVSQKRIPFVKIGAAVRFTPDQLESFIRSSSR